MVKAALYVRLEAKPGKEAEVENFLKSALPVVQNEPATTAWFAIRLGESTFGIFDAFPDERGRQAHLAGRVAAAMMAKADDLLAEPPLIQNVEVLGAKLPGVWLWKQKLAPSKVGTALAITGLVAAGWFATKRYFTTGTRYKVLKREPAISSL